MSLHGIICSLCPLCIELLSVIIIQPESRLVSMWVVWLARCERGMLMKTETTPM